MPFTPESVEELDAVGVAFADVIQALSDGVDIADAAAALTAVMSIPSVVDEFKADKGRAAAVVLGTAAREIGVS